jgi:hypothetical protein
MQRANIKAALAKSGLENLRKAVQPNCLDLRPDRFVIAHRGGRNRT